MQAVGAADLQEVIESVRFGVVRITEKSLFSNNRCLVETTHVDESGYIWCITSDTLPAAYQSGKTFPVSLKYVNREQHNYLKITGESTIVEVKQDLASGKKGRNLTYIKIRVLEAQFFKKKTLSKYTSIFQSVWKISFRIFPRKKLLKAAS